MCVRHLTRRRCRHTELAGLVDALLALAACPHSNHLWLPWMLEKWIWFRTKCSRSVKNFLALVTVGYVALRGLGHVICRGLAFNPFLDREREVVGRHALREQVPTVGAAESIAKCLDDFLL